MYKQYQSLESDLSHRAESYGKLAGGLIAMGADVHSLWTVPPHGSAVARPRINGDMSRLDPFVSFLTGVFNSEPYWTDSNLSHAVSRWGELLLEGGHSLQDYISAENVSLRSFDFSLKSSLSQSDSIEVTHLVLDKNSKLALEVVNVLGIRVYEAQHTFAPGAWPSPSPPYVPDTLIWRPDPIDEQDGLRWVCTGVVSIRSHLHQVKPLPAPDHEASLDRSFHLARKHLHERSQDDHGAKAEIWTRELKARETRNHTLRRRAASVPHFTKIPQGRRSTQYGPSHSWLRKYALRFHKCIFDSRWALQYGHGFLRGCMQGHGRDNDFTTLQLWEHELFNDQAHISVARRYAERFYPGKLHVVEETLERANDQARRRLFRRDLEIQST
jgi:hypothetical protein